MNLKTIFLILILSLLASIQFSAQICQSAFSVKLNRAAPFGDKYGVNWKGDQNLTYAVEVGSTGFTPMSGAEDTLVYGSNSLIDDSLITLNQNVIGTFVPMNNKELYIYPTCVDITLIEFSGPFDLTYPVPPPPCGDSPYNPCVYDLYDTTVVGTCFIIPPEYFDSIPQSYQSSCAPNGPIGAEDFGGWFQFVAPWNGEIVVSSGNYYSVFDSDSAEVFCQSDCIPGEGPGDSISIGGLVPFETYLLRTETGVWQSACMNVFSWSIGAYLCIQNPPPPPPLSAGFPLPNSLDWLCGEERPFPSLTISGGCPPYDTSYTDLSFGVTCQIIESNYVISDACGNVQSTNLTWYTDKIDTVAPSIDCSAVPLDLQADTSGAFIVPDYTAALFVEDCNFNGGTFSGSLNQTPIPGTVVTEGAIVNLTFTAVDECNNNGQCSTTVLAGMDSLIVTTNASVADSICEGDFQDYDPQFMISGGCPPFMVDYTEILFGGPCPGIYERTYIVSDSCGQESEPFVFYIFCVDSLNCGVPPLTLDVNPSSTEFSCFDSIIPPEVIISGGCEPYILEHDSVLNSTCPDEWVHSYFVTDSCGNNLGQTYTLTIHDTIPPVIDCSGMFDTLPGYGGYIIMPDVLSYIQASDCSDLVYTQSPLAGTILSEGTTCINLSAQDVCGNFSSCEPCFYCCLACEDTTISLSENWISQMSQVIVTGENIHLTLSPDVPPLDIQIFDAQGRLMTRKEHVFGRLEFSAANWAVGTYILQLTSKEGERRTERFVLGQ